MKYSYDYRAIAKQVKANFSTTGDPQKTPANAPIITVSTIDADLCGQSTTFS
jgi:hypothetical protein